MSPQIEKRVAALEQELAQLKQTIATGESTKPCWEKIAGTFHDDEVYKQAMKLGRQYRRSSKVRGSSGKQR